MSVIRRFLIVSSLGRLIRKERGGSRITEGYFAPQGGRTSLVRIDGQQCHLVLINVGQGGAAVEERTEVPRAHGDALLDVCGGKAVYERTNLTLSPGRDAVIDRYVQPSGIDLVSIAFENEDAAKSFRPPVWLGTEVTGDNAYDRHAIALNGQIEPPRLSLNSAMLDALLDVLEPRFGLGRYGGAANASRPAESDTLTRAAPTITAPSAAAVTPSIAATSEPDDQGGTDRPAVDQGAPVPASLSAGSAPNMATTKASEASSVPAGRTQSPPPPFEDKAEAGKPDARIDDVIESLSQALGAAIQQPQDGSRSDELSGSFERWQVRPRRTQQ